MKRVCLGMVLLSAALAGCFGPRAFTRGEYADPNEIVLLDDKWSQSDMQLVAKTMISSLSAWAREQDSAEKPAVVLETPKNKTAEHIDMQMLYDHIKTEMIRTGKLTVLDKAARGEIAQEYEYQGSGYVDPNQAQGPGQQKAAQYLLGGVITSIVQQVGRDKMIYYKATFELTDIKTTEIVWTDHKEIAKPFKKRSIGF